MASTKRERIKAEKPIDTPEVRKKICDLVASGLSLKAVCRMDYMPCIDTILKWRSKDKTFADQYARAYSRGTDIYFDDIIEIADTVDDANPTSVAKARLMIDARKWVVCKRKPAKYGDNAQAEDITDQVSQITIIRSKK